MNSYPIPEATVTEPETKNGQTPQTAEPYGDITAGIHALEQALSKDDSLAAELEDLIRHHATQAITPDTINALYNSLVYFLDDTAIDFLLTILTSLPDEEMVEKVREQAAPQTWQWLRRLLALYAPPLREGYAITGVSDNAWRWLNRRVYYDTVTSRWGIFLELIKFNDEKVILEETPVSALSLAQGILDSLNTIPADIAPDVMDHELMGEFLDECDRLREIYVPVELDQLPQVDSSIQKEHVEG